ncbi:uncharacterized protein BDZ99DRAFT_467439 [Mytilinidion resinicola]|uniref:Uncharacterized protein n=1 Tax=Mytilinidion resinicola TaxID=574789 RepID=A0A6A6Y6D4_9PEZI|nr:uncharacterized protein BDZ99DRAFT_467439 [Mytilinidion resinicola]KAF2804381.1 hypothetical protein BDZ99DRAFT_467439 [Mytilinidion resinicola]
MPEAEQTNNGDYEFLQYHTFKAVDDDRLMSWTGGSGRIGVGVREITPQNTDSDTEDMLLPGGRGMLVMDMNFKLVRKA